MIARSPWLWDLQQGGPLQLQPESLLKPPSPSRLAQRSWKIDLELAERSAPAILSVAGGHVALAIVPFPDFLPFQDTLRIVAQTGSGIGTEGWVGIFAPPETSSEEVARLSGIFRQASERSREKLRTVGFE